MYTLADIIDQSQKRAADRQAAPQKTLVRGPGGQLAQESQAGLQQLTANAGLAAPPTTPAGAGMLGASPDQAKMAGTPAQKQAALNIAQGVQTLQTAQRVDTTRTQATAGEQKKVEEAKQLGGLSNLGTRVQTAIDTALKAAPAPTQVVQKVGDKFDQVALELNVPEAAKANFKQLLNQYYSAPSSELLAQLNIAAGRNPTNMLTAEQLQSMGASAEQTVAGAVATGIKPDNINVSDLTSQAEFGYTPDQLDQLLGLAPGSASKMTVQQLQAAIQQEQQNEFTAQQQAAQAATAGGSAERAATHLALRGQSGVGITQAEQQVADIADAASRGDKVMLGNVQYDVKQLLSDDGLSSIVKNYLADPNSAQSKAIAAQNPDFVKFINQNGDALKAAISAQNIGVEKFRDLQGKVSALKAGLGNLPPAALKAMGIPDSFITSEDQLSQVKPIAYLAQKDKNVAAALTNNPDEAEALAGLSEADLNKLEIGKPGSKWDQYLSAKKEMARIDALPDNDLDAVLDAAFGSAPIAKQEFQQDMKLAAAGMPSNKGRWALLDANGDGRIDSPAEIKRRLHTQTGTLQDALQGVFKGPQKRDASAARPNLNPEQSSLFDTLSGKGFLDDGVLTPNELSDAHLSTKQLSTLLEGSANNPATWTAANNELNRRNEANWNSLRGTLFKFDANKGGEVPDEQAIRETLAKADSDPNLSKQNLINRIDDYRKKIEKEKKKIASLYGSNKIGQERTPQGTLRLDEKSGVAGKNVKKVSDKDPTDDYGPIQFR